MLLTIINRYGMPITTKLVFPGKVDAAIRYYNRLGYSVEVDDPLG